MPLQNILITIEGANPQTRLLQINVDPGSGQGSGQVTYQGVNSGADTITATAEVDNALQTSNTAQVNWQQSNGRVQLGSQVTMYMWDDSSHSRIVEYTKFNANDPAAAGAGAGSSRARDAASGCAILSDSYGYVGSAQGNSLNIDYPTAGSGALNWETLTTAGAGSGSTAPFSSTTADFNLVMIATLVVPDTNSHTISVTSQNDAMIGIGGGAVFTPVTGFTGQTMSARNGFPLLLSSHSSDGSRSSTASGSFSVSTPGLYPIETDFDYWDAGRTLHVTVDGHEIAPVDLVTVPTSSPATGNLAITPSGGATNLLVQNQTVTLTVTLTGVTFTSTPYLPILEGVAGSVFLSNQPGTTSFNFPAIPGGGTVDYTAAAGIFSLGQSSNTSWQNRLGITPLANGYALSYNGNPLDAGVDVTNLTVVQQDLAWFNTANKSFDAYTVTSAGGGVKVTIPVYWMVQPAASVAGGPLLANGTQQSLSVNLAKPLPPVQKNIVALFTASGGVRVDETIPVFSSGWLTGWTLLVTPPAGVSGSFTLTASASDTLTYLGQAGIVTGLVPYLTNTQIGTISLSTGTGGNNPIPSIVSLSPVNLPMGGSGFALNISGSGFVPGSTVSFGGTSVAAAYVGPTQLTAAIPATLVSGPGSSNVLVTNPTPGGGQSNSVQFTVTFGTTGSLPVGVGLGNLHSMIGTGATVYSSAVSPVSTSQIIPGGGTLSFTPSVDGSGTGGGLYGNGTGYVDVSIDGGVTWGAASFGHASCTASSTSTSVADVGVVTNTPVSFDLSRIRFRICLSGGGDSSYNVTYQAPSTVTIGW